ncbi:hypothetical protein VTL71DRAFT_11951 [Oculimacula yallundae]|uniref:Uncharacterized protein n=1 Tax=Oculimacula yallundae TaxID=86028 RepID=A0ABR4CTC5_9HELO
MSGQTPLTPPNDASTEVGAFYSGASPPSLPHLYSAYGALDTPNSMGSDSPEVKADGDVKEPPTSSDDEEEQDMSDGGTALTMTLSHAEALNNEMDLLDAELMGHHNMLEISDFDSDSYPPGPFFSQVEANFPLWSNMETLQNMQYDSVHPSAIPAMSEVSQVLQHLQDGQNGQVHLEFDMDDEPGVMHGGNLQQSTPSILLPFFQNILQNGGVGIEGPLPNFVVMSQVAPATLPAMQPAWLGSTGGPQNTAPHTQHPTQFHVPTVPIEDELDADQGEVQDTTNHTLASFLHRWGTSAAATKHRARGPSLESLREQTLEIPPPMLRSDLHGERCDIQRINWHGLGVKRMEARQHRRLTYKNYTNLRFSPKWHPRLYGARLEDDQNFFRFRRMDFDHDINMTHFQLRNLVACASRDHVFYAGKAQVMHWNPSGGSSQPDVALDLSNPTVQPAHWQFGNLPGIQVSTLSIGHDFLVAGGFNGEYALTNLRSQKTSLHTEGLVTENANSITNHIEVHTTPNSSAPMVAFASNDSFLRILDIGTDTFIGSHKYDHAINCSSISPDKRLRCLVGDSRQVLICHAETGEILQSLEGHRDYGFACDWADDGWTVATGNQDMQVKIWDARKWTNSSGIAQCVATIAAEIAGVRSLKFSPLGSGKRVLLAAEPADTISVIDGETFTSKQTLSFFGEIGGMDFTNDGQDLFVANCDDTRGGLMQYERCGLASHGLYSLEDYNPRRKSRNRRRGEGYDWKRTDEDLVRHPGVRGTEEHRHRRAAKLGVAMGFF